MAAVANDVCRLGFALAIGAAILSVGLGVAMAARVGTLLFVVHGTDPLLRWMIGLEICFPRKLVSKQAFEKKIEDLKILRTPGELRKPLQDRNNYLVSKAAEIAATLKLEDLIPDLLAAFDRFLVDPVKSDPQCWAKTAIAKALKNLGHRDASVFLRGIAYRQLEPVRNGRADSAGTLRGICTLAVIDCQLDDLEILKHLTDRLADPETPVRLDAALAIGQFGRPEGILPLRLKALLSDEEPEVTGQCFTSLLAMDSQEAISFIRQFLEAKNDETAAEAARALAQSREPEALVILKELYQKKLPAELRHNILISLGASPLREAADFLLSVVRTEPAELAVSALTSLAASRFRAEVRDAAQAAAGSRQEPALLQTFQREFRL
jgi:HEAT repeat protein